jgi:hypothetical protein
VFPPSLASRLLAVGRWLAAGTLKATPSPCRDGVISTKQHMTFGEFYLHCAFTTRWHHDCCYCMHAALLLLLLRGTAAANDIYWPHSHPGPQPSARSSGPRASHAIRHPYALRSRVFLGKSIGAQADEAGRTEGINSGEPPAAQPSIPPTITAHTKTQSVPMRDRRYRNQRPVSLPLSLSPCVRFSTSSLALPPQGIVLRATPPPPLACSPTDPLYPTHTARQWAHTQADMLTFV